MACLVIGPGCGWGLEFDLQSLTTYEMSAIHVSPRNEKLEAENLIETRLRIGMNHHCDATDLKSARNKLDVAMRSLIVALEASSEGYVVGRRRGCPPRGHSPQARYCVYETSESINPRGRERCASLKPTQSVNVKQKSL